MGSYEKLIQNGNAYLDLNDYENAKKNFQQAILYYPEQYMGWWGMIQCCVHRMGVKSGKWDKIKQY